MTKTWKSAFLMLLLLLAVSLPYGCCPDCDDPADPGDGEEQAPETTIDSGPEGTVTTGDVSFSWSGTDPDGDADTLTFSWILENHETAWTEYSNSTMVDYTGLADGTYTFKVRARDSAGTVDPTPAERTFTVDTSGGDPDDTTPPDTQITEGPEGTVNSSDVYFAFTGTDNNDAADDLVFSHRMDGGSWSTYAADQSAAFNGLADGDHTFEVRARDTAGNEDSSPASRSFTIDTSGGDLPPTVIITSGPSGTIEYTEVTFTYIGSDDIDPPSALVYQHRMDGGSWSAWGGSTTALYGGLTDGNHLFEVRARDTSGNVGNPDSRSFTVDAGEPPDDVAPETMITSGPSGTIDYANVTFTYTGTDNVDPPSMLTFRHRMDNGAWSGWSGTTTAQYNGLANGNHLFEVQARDSAGNIDQTPDSRSFTVEIATAGLVFDFPVKHATGPAGQYVAIHGTLTNNLGSEVRCRFWATSTPADWSNAYCPPGICVPWETVLEWDVDVGTHDVSIDFSPPEGTPVGTNSSLTLFVEYIADPTVTDSQTCTFTVE